MRGIRSFVIPLLIAVVLVSFVITGCTRYAKEEQLTALDEAKAANESANAKVAELEQEKAELERKLKEKQAELEEVLKEKEKVQSML